MPYKNKEDAKKHNNEYNKKWYQKNRAARLAYMLNYNKQRELEIKKKIDEYKQSKGCIKCQETDPCCLDFHHIDENDKLFAIATYRSKRHSWDKIENEIKKCEILCANCHRKLHKNNGYPWEVKNVPVVPR